MNIINRLLFVFLVIGCSTSSEKSKYLFKISFSDVLSNQARDGRLPLMNYNINENEARFQITNGLNTQLIIGMDVEDLSPDDEITIDAPVFGIPSISTDGINAGSYYVRTVLNRYETNNTSSCHQVKLPPDKGEGQQWDRKPVNFYSLPILLELNEGGKYNIVMVHEIPPIDIPKDAKYLKHIKLKSQLLSEFRSVSMNQHQKMQT